MGKYVPLIYASTVGTQRTHGMIESFHALYTVDVSGGRYGPDSCSNRSAHISGVPDQIGSDQFRSDHIRSPFHDFYLFLETERFLVYNIPIVAQMYRFRSPIEELYTRPKSCP